MQLPDYPVVDALPALKAALQDRGVAVLSAPPGSGKTTVVPLALLDEPWLKKDRIVVLEPRRVAARQSARRMAELCGEPVGQTVGYQVRFERKVSSSTRVEIITEGLLTRRIQSDPELPGTGLLIFDEFHERSLDADLALALSLESRAVLRPGLRVLVMSATLDTERISRLLDNAPVIEASGRMFPVTVHHQATATAADVSGAVAERAYQVLQQPGGDVLAFLPGVREIGQTQRELQERKPDAAIRPLYGQLPTHAQDLALRPDAEGRRRIILATNIAQTSLTVDGVDTVIDGGFTRAPVFDPGAGADRLVTRRVSRASAEQRAGRAGRLGPGQVWRLWSAEQHGMLDAQDAPEILCADLSGFALQLAAFGITDASQLALLDPPPQAHWSWAQELLQLMNALDESGRITEHGRALSRLPLTPRLAQLMFLARDAGLAETGAWLATTLEMPPKGPSSDLLTQLDQLRRDGRSDLPARSVRQLLQAVNQTCDEKTASPEQQAALVAQAFPERLARRRSGLREKTNAHPGAHREFAFQCVDGGEARLPENDALAHSEWLAIAHWAPGSQRKVRLACAIDETTLLTQFGDQLRSIDEVYWSEREEAVIARRSQQLGALVIREKPLDADPDRLCTAMLDGVRKLGLHALPWQDADRQWQARVSSLRCWQTDGNWPDVSDTALLAGLNQWLGPFLIGITRRAHLSRLDLSSALQSMLDYPQQQSLTRLAPTDIDVPSGRRLRLTYTDDGGAPTLDVKLQEMFGCTESPAVCNGQLRVRLNLLSPAARPIAVTDDIGRFWKSGYPDVRKDLRGRYPKHPWPEDPLTATATHRAKPRIRP